MRPPNCSPMTCKNTCIQFFWGLIAFRAHLCCLGWRVAAARSAGALRCWYSCSAFATTDACIY